MTGSERFGSEASENYVAHIVMYSHDFFLEETVESLASHVDRILIARTTRPWEGLPCDLAETDHVLERLRERYGERIEVYTDAFPDQATQRNFLLTVSRSRGHRGAFIVDCDEVFCGDALPNILAYIHEERPPALRVPYLTFVKDASFCVAPPYETGLFYLDLTHDPRFLDRRTPSVSAAVMRYDEPDILHFSYIRQRDEDIERKVRTFSAARDTDWEIWLEQVYRKFHPRLVNFHPVQPNIWSRLIPFDARRFPAGLRAKLARYKKLAHTTHIAGNPSLKLNVGAGSTHMDGYVNIDLYNPAADMQLDITNLHYFQDNSVEEIYAKAVIEHLFTFEQRHALREWHRVLKPNGRLVIRSLPDFDEVVKAYLDQAPGHMGPVFDHEEVVRYLHAPYTRDDWRGQLHKDSFTKGKLRRLLEEAGFEDIRIENVCAPGEANPVNIDATAVKRRGTLAAAQPEVVWEGFHGDEEGWRWMSERGVLTVIEVPGVQVSTVVFEVSCGEAGHYPAFPFMLWIQTDEGWRKQVRFTHSHQRHRVEVPIAGEWGPPHRVRFVSEQSYVPQERGINGDVRCLAVRIGGVVVVVDGNGAGIEPRMSLAVAEDALSRRAWAEACHAFIEVLTQDRSCARARSGLGLALLGLGDAPEALAQLHEAVRSEPSPDLVTNLASGLIHVGCLNEAEQLLRGVLAVQPTHDAARFNLSRLHEVQGVGTDA